MTIVLSQKHIDEGVAMDCGACPAALAVAEATGEKTTVGGHTICWGLNMGHNSHYWKHFAKTPKHVVKFMNRFDAGLPVEPITFELVAA